MFPLGLVTMLFLVLFVWGCAGKERKGKGGDTTKSVTVTTGRHRSVSVCVCPCMCAHVCTVNVCFSTYPGTSILLRTNYEFTTAK